MTVEVIDKQTPATRQEHPAEMARPLFDVIARAASDPTVDVDKMQRLLDMQLALMARAAEASFNRALAKLKPLLPTITKNGTIVIVKNGVELGRIAFAKYEDIHRVVMPLLTDAGFTVTYSSELIADAHRLRVTATFRHEDGHSDVGSVYLPLTDDSGAKNAVQGVGSILSYGKRYALCNYLDIVAEGADDDGTQGAMQPISDEQVSKIVDLITDIRDNGQTFNDAGFLKLMKVKRIEDIVAGDFQKAVSALNDKRRSGK